MSGHTSKPRVFIGSSTEGLEIAKEIQSGLSRESLAHVWDQGLFPLSRGTLESLAHEARGFDFAVLVLTPDDVVEKRHLASRAPRDNVLLELGIFIGALGRERTFMVHCRDTPIALPSDLAGITCATYPLAEDQDLPAALGPVCTEIRRQIRKTMAAENGGNGQVHEALPSVQDSTSNRSLAHATRAEKVPRRRRRRSLGSALVDPRTSYKINNISVSGALIETDGEMPIGEILSLQLLLDDGRSLRVKARVARIQRPDWGKVGGVGFAFDGLDEEAKQTITEYVYADEAVHSGDAD